MNFSSVSRPIQPPQAASLSCWHPSFVIRHLYCRTRSRLADRYFGGRNDPKQFFSCTFLPSCRSLEPSELLQERAYVPTRGFRSLLQHADTASYLRQSFGLAVSRDAVEGLSSRHLLSHLHISYNY